MSGPLAAAGRSERAPPPDVALSVRVPAAVPPGNVTRTPMFVLALPVCGSTKVAWALFAKRNVTAPDCACAAGWGRLGNKETTRPIATRMDNDRRPLRLNVIQVNIALPRVWLSSPP